MTAKEYLSQLPKLRCYIRALEESYEVQQVRATQRTQKLKEVQVQTSRKLDKQEDAALKMVEIGIQIETAIKACLDLEQEAIKLISELTDNRYKTLLHLRYIDGRTWSYITEAMDYKDERWPKRMHGHALLEFERCHLTLLSPY